MNNQSAPSCFLASANPVKRQQTGISLIEFMIGMAIGLVIVASIGVIYVNNRQTLRSQDANARVQESGRFVLDVVGRSLRQAGNIHVTAGETKNYCNCTPATGTDGTLLDPAAPDTLTIQFEAGQDEVDSSDAVWKARNCAGTFVAPPNLVTNVFSVNANSELVCGGQPLVQGVEDFQITYGIDMNNDRAVDRVVTDPAGFGPTPHATQPNLKPPVPANRIVSVQVCALIRSTEQVLTKAGNYLDCTGTAQASPDLRMRRAFRATYTLRNTVVDM